MKIKAYFCKVTNLVRVKWFFAACLAVIACSNLRAESMLDSRANQIADAIYKVEGGAKTKHPYGILSVKTSDPRGVCINTIKNNFKRWQDRGSKGDFLDFLADVYCPKSADPTGNANWHKNIHRLIPADKVSR